MAIAPVNKFISLAVPVAPGLQKLYEVPTGASALILYAQVANVGINTYPTTTFIQRRESRSTGLTRDIRVIKDVEIPPNDAVVIVDGRLVLEKTPTTLDRIFLSGVQSGVSTITDVVYCEPLGIATVTTIDNHGFLKGDQITLGGIAFTCSNNNSGITTTIFPDPQASYTIIDVNNVKSFVTEVGTSNGINHFFNPAIHTFVRAGVNSITRTSTGAKYTATGGTYDAKTGVLGLTIANHNIMSSATTKNVNSAIYDGNSGIMTVTSNGHGLTTNSIVKFGDNKLRFKCAMDGNTAIKTYPRTTDPVSGVFKPITDVTTNTFKVNVGESRIVTFTPTDVVFNTTVGIMTCTIGANTLRTGTSVKLATGSLTFVTSSGTITYPQSGNTGAYDTAIGITSNTTTTITLDVGTAGASGIYTFTSAASGAVISGGNYTHTWVGDDGVGGIAANAMTTGTERIGIATNSVIFTCSQDGNNSEHGYPRIGDPAHNVNLYIIESTTNTINVNVGISTQGGLVAPLQMEFLASILENSNA
tara:strand:- start:4473 stop:6065 length:1593 start_codon:yes stop_codon:yes gene_type:complete